MKKLIIIFLLCISSVNAQTLSDSVKQLWRTVYGGVQDTSVIMPVLKDSLLTYPDPNVSIISQLYFNPVIISQNKFRLFYFWIQNGTVTKLNFESNFRYWNYTNLKTNFGTGAESIFYWNGFWYGSLHKWSNNVCYQQMRKSTDNASNFFDIGPSVIQGEDQFFDTFRSDSVWSYNRPVGISNNSIIREIALKKSKDLINWTANKVILSPDQQDRSANLQYYVMPVFHIQRDNGAYGLLTILNTVTQNVYVQLVYSSDGESNWLRCKNRKTFLTIPNGIHQQYPLPLVYNDTLHCITSMAKTTHGSANEKFGIYDFTIATRDLGGWKN